MDLNRVFFFREQLLWKRLFHVTGNQKKKKNLCDNVFAARMAKYHMFSDRRIIIIIKDTYNYCRVRFVKVCTKNKFVHSLLELH